MNSRFAAFLAAVVALPLPACVTSRGPHSTSDPSPVTLLSVLTDDGSERHGLAGVAPPRIVKLVRPKYPDELRSQLTQGMITARAVITANGKAEEIRIVQGLHPLLDEEAERVIALWSFAPATRGGESLKVLVEIRLGFVFR